MMNLCIVTPAENLYSETFIQNQINYLNFNKYLLYGTEIKNLQYNGKYLVPLYWYNRLAQKILKAIFKDENILFTLKLKLFLKKNKIESVLAQYGPTGAMLAPICYQLKIPLTVHFHGNDASVYSIIEKFKGSYSYMFEKAKAAIVVSSSMVKRLEKLGAPSDKIKFNCYGIDTNLFKKTDRPNNKKILAVGRFVDKKAPHLSILCFYKAYQYNQELKMHMVGDGPLLNACKALVKALKLEDAVVFEGICSTEKIIQLHNQTDIFIQHSVIAENGDAEGTPLAILEAMSSGIPVISTCHEGIADVIEDGYNGFLVNEYDVDLMSKKILEIIDNKPLFYNLGENARHSIERKYALKIYIEKLNEIIKSN